MYVNKTLWRYDIKTLIHIGLVLLVFSIPLRLVLEVHLPILLFLLWLYEGDLKEKWNILKQNNFFWISVSLLGVLFFSLLMSDSNSNGFWHTKYTNGYEFFVRRYIHSFLVVPIIITHINKKLIYDMLSGFLLAMFISEIISYGIFLEILEFRGRLPSNPTPFFNHSPYSMLIVFAIIIMIDRLKNEKRIVAKIFYIFFILISLTNLFINGGRIGYLILFVASFGYLFFNNKISAKMISITMVFLISVYLLAYNLSDNFNKRVHYTINSIEEIIDGDLENSFGHRLQMWNIALQSSKNNIAFGHGLGDARGDYQNFIENHKLSTTVKNYIHLHNQFIQLFYDSGLLAIFIYLSIFLLMIKMNFFEYNSIAKIFMLISFFYSLINPPLLGAQTLPLFFIFWSLLFSYQQKFKTFKNQ